MKKNSNLTTFAILTTLTILTWVAVEAYHRYRATNYGPISPQVLLPLNPSLNSKVLEEIQNRRHFSDEEIANFKPNTSSSVSATVPPSPSANPSSQATDGATATNSASR